MNQAEFAHALSGAQEPQRTATGCEIGFWQGYARGLRRSFHGVIFGTSAEHDLWLSLRDARGAGYEAGYRGLSVREAIREAELREEQAEARARRPDFYSGIQDARDGEQP